MKSILTDTVIDGMTVSVSSLFRESGQEVVLFIHGLGCAGEAFEEAFAAPGLDRFTLLSPDLAGFGGSSRPDGFSYRIEDHAAVLKRLLNSIGAGTVHIVAHSMGGAVGLLLAQTIPRMIGSFASVEGNLTSEDCGVMSRRAFSAGYPVFRRTVFDEIKSACRTSCGERISAWLDKSDPLGFYRSASSLVAWSDSGRLLPMFHALDKRKIYVYGKENAGLSVLGRLGAVRRVCIAGSGHFPMLDNPLEFYGVISSHVGAGRKTEQQ